MTQVLSIQSRCYLTPQITAQTNIASQVALLRSLAHCVECYIIDPFKMALLKTDPTRWVLCAYTEILQSHRDAFPALLAIRLEKNTGGDATTEALIHTALDGDGEQVGDTAQVLTGDASEDESMWTVLEDVLRGFPALTRVDLAIFHSSLVETKAESRGDIPGCGGTELRNL